MPDEKTYHHNFSDREICTIIEGLRALQRAEEERERFCINNKEMYLEDDEILSMLEIDTLCGEINFP